MRRNTLTADWNKFLLFFFSSRRRHTRFRNVTGVQTCALPILFAAHRGVGWVTCLAVDPRELEPRRVICRRILRGFPVPRAWIFQRLFLSLLVCERSFSIFGQHGAAGISRRRHRNGL